LDFCGSDITVLKILGQPWQRIASFNAPIQKSASNVFETRQDNNLRRYLEEAIQIQDIPHCLEFEDLLKIFGN